MRKHWLIKFMTLPIRVLIIAASVAELVLRPLYRPLVTSITRFSLFARIERWIASLPRLAILVSLAVPFAVAEPLKLLGVVMIAKGYLATGTMMLVLSYLATFLIVERIYHVGRDKLLTYRWLAWVMKHVTTAMAYYDRIKAAVMAPVRVFMAWLSHLAT